MTNRSEQQVIDKRGSGYLEMELSAYVVNSLENDYGLDYEVNLTDESIEDEYQEVTGDHFFIQLKSSAGFDSDETVYTDLSTDHISQYLAQPIPVILVIYDDEYEEAYWRVVQEFVWDDLKSHNKNWREQTTVRIRITRSRTIQNLDQLETAVNRTQNRITREHSRGLNVGEGIAFSPENFQELQKQIKADQLSYKAHRLLEARQYLKRGEDVEAEESIKKVLDAPDDDETKVKAYLMKMIMRNYSETDQAFEIISLAEEAIDIASQLDMEAEKKILELYKQVAGLFVCHNKRRKMLVTDVVQNIEDYGLPSAEYGLLRTAGELEILQFELSAISTVNRVLSDLLESDEYYWYSFCLAPVIDYLASRISLETMSPDSEVSPSSPDERTEPHPLVAQAEQLCDFIEDPELEYSLRRSLALYHYNVVNPKKAIECYTKARDLALGYEDTTQVENTEELIAIVQDRPNPYEYNDDNDETDIEELTRTVLELQGFDVSGDRGNSIDADYREGNSETLGREIDARVSEVLQSGVADADPEPYHRHCAHIRLAYEPDFLGELTGVVSIGEKSLWCQHGGGMFGENLNDLFSMFKDEYCDGCQYHSPRRQEWEFTNEYVTLQTYDPEFRRFIEQKEILKSLLKIWQTSNESSSTTETKVTKQDNHSEG